LVFEAGQHLGFVKIGCVMIYHVKKLPFFSHHPAITMKASFFAIPFLKLIVGPCKWSWWKIEKIPFFIGLFQVSGVKYQGGWICFFQAILLVGRSKRNEIPFKL